MAERTDRQERTPLAQRYISRYTNHALFLLEVKNPKKVMPSSTADCFKKNVERDLSTLAQYNTEDILHGINLMYFGGKGSILCEFGREYSGLVLKTEGSSSNSDRIFIGYIRDEEDKKNFDNAEESIGGKLVVSAGRGSTEEKVYKQILTNSKDIRLIEFNVQPQEYPSAKATKGRLRMLSGIELGFPFIRGREAKEVEDDIRVKAQELAKEQLNQQQKEIPISRSRNSALFDAWASNPNRIPLGGPLRHPPQQDALRNGVFTNEGATIPKGPRWHWADETGDHGIGSVPILRDEQSNPGIEGLHEDNPQNTFNRGVRVNPRFRKS